MKVHLLTGDSLLHGFKQLGIEGQTIISRECLIVGETRGQNLADFWQTRATYIQAAYDEPPANYHQQVVQEYEKLLNLPPSTELYLWFEYDLFCQVNRWFALWLIHNKPFKSIYRVHPVTRTAQDRWKGFGSMSTEDLRICYNNPVIFTQEDSTLGMDLWLAFQHKDLISLKKLSQTPTACIPYLSEVCTAYLESVQHRRPERVLQHLVEKGITDFGQLFTLFSQSEGIYGYGDLQVKEMYNNLYR